MVWSNRQSELWVAGGSWIWIRNHQLLDESSTLELASDGIHQFGAVHQGCPATIGILWICSRVVSIPPKFLIAMWVYSALDESPLFVASNPKSSEFNPHFVVADFHHFLLLQLPIHAWIPLVNSGNQLFGEDTPFSSIMFPANLHFYSRFLQDWGFPSHVLTTRGHHSPPRSSHQSPPNFPRLSPWNSLLMIKCTSIPMEIPHETRQKQHESTESTSNLHEIPIHPH